MKQARRIGRLGILAAGIGIGAALAATAGTASADPSTDPWIDQLLGGLSVPAPAASLDMQVSIDETDLFPTAGNTATATSDMGDIAIAIGAGSTATATGGIFDTAFADGTTSAATAISGNFDSATAVGNSIVVAGFGNGDVASAVNTGSALDTAQAGGVAGFLGSNDTAFVLGTGSTADAGADFSAAGNFDLGAVFGDAFNSTGATGGNFLVDILPSL